MAIFLPQTPILNQGNPLTNGLVFDSPFFQGGGTIVKDSVFQSPGTITGATWDINGSSDASLTSAVQNIRDLDFSAASSEVLYSNLPASTNTLVKFSCEFLVYYRTTGGGGLGRIAQKTNTLTNGRWFLFTGSNASNQLAFQLTTSGTAGLWRYNNFFLSTSMWIHGVVTFDGSTITNTPSVYKNGLLTTADSSVTATGTWNTDDSYLSIGNRNNAATRNWDGKIAYFRMWNRILLPQEAKSLHADPWQIYVRPNFTRYYNSNPVVATNIPQRGYLYNQTINRSNSF